MSDQNSNPVEEPLNGGSSAGDTSEVGENAGFAEDPGYDGPTEDASFEDADVETSLTDADLSFLEQAESDLAAERLADLQRVTAEYANYRKRTEANREIERERIIGDTVKILLPVLDDIDRAEKHGDLAEGSALAAIAGKLRGATERLGLVAYGAAGDLFDPNLHEAILQQPSPDVTAETVLDVVETGYMIGTTQVRAAKVVVAVPAN
ncbi:nucleotide exchange factor GrpE [Aurantimicrobium minutum]|jgi:molecular chaperone GrpE|uniref:Protein GrpE n=1 Tax=Aurantimicrobium minutum TaxID=708131 RepID=A0A173LYL9_9MICO|nr:nucleotide exchange factor GrpE [Aurantimicrobium minutum]MDH6238659.1 molecular chaperone GrpE [Aurantimicrobium minutum]BAU99963.1 heat shock chaperone [Aurantimicrobium minutum]